MSKVIIVSSCLAGVKCRYDGKDNRNEGIVELVRKGIAIPLCPELLGGLKTPRDCCEMQMSESGERKVVSNKGVDCTFEYMEGAKKTLDIAKVVGADIAILQKRSPSCGCGKIYDGKFSRNLIEGNGVTADLLLKNGIKVCNDDDYMDFL